MSQRVQMALGSSRERRPLAADKERPLALRSRGQSNGCIITRSKDSINKFAVVCGLWHKITTGLLP